MAVMSFTSALNVMYWQDNCASDRNREKFCE